MKKNYKIFLLLMLLVCSKAQAQTVFKANEIGPLPAEQAMLSKVFKKQILVQLNAEAIYQLVKQAGNSSRFIIEAGNLFNWNIDLQIHDMRSPDYLHQVTTAKGLETIPKGECITYAGSLYGNLNNTVRLNIRPGQIDGLIIDNGENIFIEPLKHFIKTASKDRFVIYKRGDVINHGGTCGGGTIAEKSEQQSSRLNVSSAAPLAADCRKIEIATESDGECFNDGFGTDDILANLNLVEPLYQNSFGASFVIRYQHEWTTTSDPYTSEDVCIGTDRLSQFKDYWNANFSYINRDLAFMYTGVDFNGSTIGCAYTGTFKAYSDNSVSYGTAQETQPLFGFSAGERQVLVAHEIGHIFGCAHDETGCSFFSPGPIMCPGLDVSCTGGCTPYWSQRSIDSINISMTSANGSNKLRSRVFSGPVIGGSFSGNELFISTSNFSLFGFPFSTTYTGTDNLTLLPGFSAVVDPVGSSVNVVIGPCDINGGVPPGTNTREPVPKYSSTGNITTAATTRIKVYPNPFSNFTNIDIELATASSVSVSVYDLTGRLVDKPIISKQMGAGKNTITYNTGKLQSNAYLLIIEVNGMRYTEKVIKI